MRPRDGLGNFGAVHSLADDEKREAHPALMSLSSDPLLPSADTHSAEEAAALPATPPSIPEAANADPLTGEAGAHPVGVGLGAAATGVVGAALGAIAGPAGVIAGTAAGALAGGLLGKQAAEAVNPTHEPEVVATNVASAGSTAEPSASSNELENAEVEAPTRPHKIAMPQSTTIIARTSYPEGNVRVAAYYRYLHRHEQGLGGDEIDDWVEAEKQVLRVD